MNVSVTELILIAVILLTVGGGMGVLVARRGSKALPPGGAETPPSRTSGPDVQALPPGAEAQSDASVAAAEKVLLPPSERDGFFKRLVAGLSRTQGQLVERLDGALRGRKEIDAALYEELELILLQADVGAKTTTRLLEVLKQRASREELKNPAVLRTYLQEEIRQILKVGNPNLNLTGQGPDVVLIVGVNGVGKTTTIGKVASRLTRDGKKVILAAGDTFRAAAIEQLEIWGERAGCEVVKNKEGSDPSAVVFDAITAAKARGVDVVLADTAGRLHTKSNLMDELKKVTRVAGKALPGAPHEVLLVLDSTMGQNAFNQARIFHEGCQLTGLILTKLDGTAKGGVIIGICDELKLPVKFIGVGEKVDDLQPFDPDQFVAALF
ncbi:MAG: signal recognition particle-docking protein FtsY [Myxococcota bacterium]